MGLTENIILMIKEIKSLKFFFIISMFFLSLEVIYLIIGFLLALIANQEQELISRLNIFIGMVYIYFILWFIPLKYLFKLAKNPLELKYTTLINVIFFNAILFYILPLLPIMLNIIIIFFYISILISQLIEFILSLKKIFFLKNFYISLQILFIFIIFLSISLTSTVSITIMYIYLLSLFFPLKILFFLIKLSSNKLQKTVFIFIQSLLWNTLIIGFSVIFIEKISIFPIIDSVINLIYIVFIIFECFLLSSYFILILSELKKISSLLSQ